MENNKLKITYLLENILINDIYKGYFIKSCVCENVSLFKKIKIGKWKKVKLDYVGNIVYLYN